MKTVLEHAAAETSLYDSDFYLWTQEQAALLRQVPRGSFALDIENLAEEIESMGRSELNKVSSMLRQTLIHLLKLTIASDRPSREQSVSDVMTFQADALLTFTPGMKQLVDLDRIWKTVRNGATYFFERSPEIVSAFPATCPFNLDELLADDFAPARMVERIKSGLQRPHTTH